MTNDRNTLEKHSNPYHCNTFKYLRNLGPVYLYCLMSVKNKTFKTLREKEKLLNVAN